MESNFLEIKVEQNESKLKKLWKMILLVGPGIFLVGYSIGTGSVVSMASAGSQYGMSLLWAMVLACLFSFVMLEAYGRYTCVTGKSALQSYRMFPFGRTIAIITLIALVVAEIMALMGIMGILSDIILEWFKMFMTFGVSDYAMRIIITAVVISIIYVLLLCGKYTVLEKVLIVFVTSMALSFVVTMFLVIPSPKELTRGLVPMIPTDLSGSMVLAAIVGTTLTAPTFIMRSILVQEKKWGIKDLGTQRLDSMVCAFFLFVISVSVMACAAGTLFIDKTPVNSVIDMVKLLEPLAGRFAISIFICGLIGAAMSSLIPITMLAPVLIGDYRGELIDLKSKNFRILAGVGLLCGFIVPLIGARPVYAMIVSQCFQIFPLPLVTVAIMYLLNRKDLMGKHKAGLWLNIGLLCTLGFALLISYQAILGLLDQLRSLPQ
jgi:Mn2+/Fe2+ NRAMP family transporter